MEIETATIKDLFIINPTVVEDERGYFEKIFSKKVFEDSHLHFDYVDLNHSKSNFKGTFRGFHYQIAPREECKLIRCTKGRIKDYIIDMRKKSSTYLQIFTVEISESNKKMIHIPAGLAHGFQTLEDNTEVVYLSSNYYDKDCEILINPRDPMFDIEFNIDPIFSEKDASSPFICNIERYSV